MLHTLNIYRHFHKNLPPLFPEDLAQEIKQSINRFDEQTDLSLKDLERQMVEHGFLVWPYHQAYREFFDETSKELADHFLEPLLSKSTLEKYQELKISGGDWDALYSGEVAEFFEPEERLELSQALVESRNKLKDFTRQNILGLNRNKYLDRVRKYNVLLEDIKKELEELKSLAENEDHLELSEQIWSKIEAIEHGFAHLGQELQYNEIMNAVEFFRGRKIDLARLRGIDVPKVIDFYNTDLTD